MLTDQKPEYMNKWFNQKYTGNVCVNVYIYIYIYMEREREREQHVNSFLNSFKKYSWFFLNP